jgi:hypothetical protein
MDPRERNAAFLEALESSMDKEIKDPQGLTHCYGILSGINYAMRELV